MTQSPGDPFGDLFAGGRNPFATPAPKKPEKGVPWEAKIIDGKYYVPLSQVSDLLAANSVLPNVKKGIDRRVELQAAKVEEEST